MAARVGLKTDAREALLDPLKEEEEEDETKEDMAAAADGDMDALRDLRL